MIRPSLATSKLTNHDTQPYIRTRLVTEAKARSPFLRDSWTVRLSSNSNSVRSCRLEVRFVRMYQIRADSTSASSSLRVLKTFPLPGFIHSFNMNQPASRTGINRFPGAQDARRPREQRHAESYLAFSQFHDYLGLTRVIEEMTGYQSKDNIATSWYNGYDSDWHGNTPQRLRATSTERVSPVPHSAVSSCIPRFKGPSSVSTKRKASHYKYNETGRHQYRTRAVSESATKPQLCVFCRKNGSTASFYCGHSLKTPGGRIICPVLRAYKCPFCSATGDNAHTMSYCEFNPNGRGKCFSRPHPEHGPVRNACGKLKRVHTPRQAQRYPSFYL